MPNQHAFQVEWNFCSNLFEKQSESFNGAFGNFRVRVLSIYDGFTHKILENLVGCENVLPVQLSFPDGGPLVYRHRLNPVSIFYVDWAFLNLKNRKRAMTTRGFTPAIRLFETLDKVKDDHMAFIREFCLLLFKENESFTAEGRIVKTEARISELMLKKYSFRCFVQYFSLILLHKHTLTPFNPVVVEVLEDWVTNNIALLSDADRTDEHSLFALLYLCYEIHCWVFRTGIGNFSSKFLRFWTNLGVWHADSFWEKAIGLCSEFSGSRETCFFVDVLKPKPTKARLKSMLSIYKMLIFMAFCFLKLPLATVLDIFNRINDRRNHLSVNAIFDLSRALEPRMFEQARGKLVPFSERSVFFLKDSTATMFVIGKAIEFVGDVRDVFRLQYLSKDFAKHMRKKALKQLLLCDGLPQELRVRLWAEVARLSLAGLPDLRQSIPGLLDPKIAHIIKMDVKRTNFVKFNKESLERLLVEVATAFPLTTYYQGMNCIGGFLLNYTDSFATSLSVFDFLMRKRLETYFLNNFERIKKVLYICERIIQMFVPRLAERLVDLHIGIELYISQILLTVFTSSLQFIDNYNLVAKIMDVFVARGWVGFFRVLVVVLRAVERKLLEKDYDKVLEFLNKSIYEHLFQLKLDHLKAECTSVPISGKLLYQLGAEFDRTRLVVENYWANYYEAKRRPKEEGSAENGAK